MQDFKGKIAVITGGASGVGRAIGAQLAAEGAIVVLADIDQAKLDATATEIAVEGATVIGLTVDVTKEASVEALAQQVYDRFGAVHLLFNNAGVGLGEARKAIWTLPVNDWRWGIDVNVMGVVHGIKAFVPRMIASGEDGVVINTSSTNGGLRSLPNTPIYAATKAAVTSISEVLYQQLLKDGGRVKAAVLFPGPHTVNTSIMASRLVRPADYAGTEPEEPVAYRTMQELVKTTGLNLQLTEPEEVASFAIEGVRAGRFWLLPESEQGDAMIRQRTEGLLARTDPVSAW
ncbi:SDR family NAD(P)-dependent oxidoreductase [Rhizorhabdus sp.]|jgi:NAD(P)-dependent dehydrogenase (short-subunit alcohol dehydrogenase family)|uniref:SDR family NAD(P)-dependent oxidoreductase n=1 Tax=Rhizorhabdus sp. TaxID=1968843 RepID=UPI001B513965|nr:SDR family NAD(P)-dependent oxidoreductase [Rhizorhabdus sp.]MBP8233415.1 SDR family NAD(P)-dependent oxidoreductase [Rhizorhabdus sp.]